VTAPRLRKRLSEHEPDIGPGCDRAGQQFVVRFFEFLRRHAPAGFIDADQDAEQVGLERQRIGLPALGQIGERIPADPPIGGPPDCRQ